MLNVRDVNQFSPRIQTGQRRGDAPRGVEPTGSASSDLIAPDMAVDNNAFAARRSQELRERQEDKRLLSEDEVRGLLVVIRQRVAEEIQRRGVRPEDQEQMRVLAREVARGYLVPLIPRQAGDIERELLSSVGGGYGRLSPLFEAPDVEEVMVNAYDSVWAVQGGKFVRTPIRFADDQDVVNFVQRLAAEAGRQFNFREPIVDVRLPDGSRMNAVLSTEFGGVSARGTAVTIRRVVARPDFASFVANGTVPTPEAGEFLAACVRGDAPLDWPLNVLVIGGMASGKSTLLNALLKLVPQDDRLVIVEDVIELDDPVPNIVRMEARRANAEGVGEVTLQTELVATLRMRPVRIVVGEMRQLEAGAFVEASSVGHPGSMSTLHGNNPAAALNRLEGLVRSANGWDDQLTRTTLCSVVQLIVHIGFRAGRRQLVEIGALEGYSAGTGYVVQPLFHWEGGQFVRTAYVPSWGAPAAKVSTQL